MTRHARIARFLDFEKLGARSLVGPDPSLGAYHVDGGHYDSTDGHGHSDHSDHVDTHRDHDDDHAASGFAEKVNPGEFSRLVSDVERRLRRFR